MPHRKEDKLKHAENLLNYIPYSKLANLESKEYLEAFFGYVSHKHSLLPELAEIMPTEQLFKFLFAYAGQTINVPDQKVILGAFRDLDIFKSLTDDPSYTEVSRLADKYQLAVQTVRASADRVAAALHKPSPIK